MRSSQLVLGLTHPEVELVGGNKPGNKSETDGTIPDASNGYSRNTPSTAGASSGSRSLPDSAAETQFPLSRFPAPPNRANLFESQPIRRIGSTT
jgi:hypothetical protein